MTKVFKERIISFFLLLLLALGIPSAQFGSYSGPTSPYAIRLRSSSSRSSLYGGENDNRELSSFENSDTSSKGIVSSLTGFVNLIMDRNKARRQMDTEENSPVSTPPSSPLDLLDRIREDYVTNNYLWTGDIHLPAFEETCEFTDPTISFVGRDKFVSNVRNLRPVVDFLIGGGDCRSDLLDIELNDQEGFVQSRWNMVGELNLLPWKPRIDVIGRTKFWYNNQKEGGVRIYYYDECWELPAGKALMQLVTPGGTIPNSLIQPGTQSNDTSVN